ncbi:MAG: hypothetical protein ABL966_14100 [Acidimicrobiales bacterium]
MRLASTKSIAAVLLTLVVMTGLGACRPTGDLRCDQLVRPVARASALGYEVRCDATFSGTSSAGQNVLGWTDHKTQTIWLWPDKMTDDRVLRKVAWHEVGHVVWERRDYSGPQSNEERWADGYAYCAEPIKGVSYANRPTDCSPFR